MDRKPGENNHWNRVLPTASTHTRRRIKCSHASWRERVEPNDILTEVLRHNRIAGMSEAVHSVFHVIVFREFQKSLSRADFDCGHPKITRWFREQAGQQERKNNVRTHLGLSTFDGEIACFYSLTAHRIETEEFEDSAVFGLRRYPLPAMLIAQLGVDLRYQGQGLGGLALADALRRLVALSTEVGFEIIVVDAIDANATTFYEKYQFNRLTADGSRLFITTQELKHNFPGETALS